MRFAFAALLAATHAAVSSPAAAQSFGYTRTEQGADITVAVRVDRGGAFFWTGEFTLGAQNGQQSFSMERGPPALAPCEEIVVTGGGEGGGWAWARRDFLAISVHLPERDDGSQVFGVNFRLQEVTPIAPTDNEPTCDAQSWREQSLELHFWTQLPLGEIRVIEAPGGLTFRLEQLP